MSSEWLDDGDKRTEIIGGWQLKMLPRHSGEQFVSQPLNPILMYGKMKAIFHFNGRHYPDPLVGHVVAFSFPLAVAEQKKSHSTTRRCQKKTSQRRSSDATDQYGGGRFNRRRCCRPTGSN